MNHALVEAEKSIKNATVVSKYEVIFLLKRDLSWYAEFSH